MGLARTPAADARIRARRAGVAAGLALLALVTLADPPARAFPLPPRGGTEYWTARLQHPDARVRRGAAWRIARYVNAPADGSDASRELPDNLLQRLRQEDDFGVRMALLYALARATPSDADDLIRRASSPVGARAVRSVALRVFASRADVTGQLGELLSLSRASAMSGEGDDASVVAIRTIAELPHARFGQAVSTGLQEGSVGGPGVLRAIGHRGDPRWALPLLDVLRAASEADAQAARLHAALDAAARLELAEAAGLVLAIAQRSGVPALRVAAVRALGSLGGAFDVSALRALVADPAVREAAIEALGALGDRGAVEVIAPSLGASWAGDRRAAAEALGAIGDPSALDALIAQARRETSAGVLRVVWRAVARVGGLRARDALLAADEPTARWALAELCLAEPASCAATDATDASGTLVAALAGGVVDLRALGGADLDRRVATAIASGFARVDATGRVRALDAALARESDEAARVAMVLALARVAGDEGSASVARSEASDALVGLVTRERESLTLASVAAMQSLGALRVEAIREVALGVAASEPRDALTRRVTLYALGRLRADAGRLAVERALFTDPDEGVRGTAAVALASLLGSGADALLAEASTLAWTGALIDRIAHARTLARSGAVGGFVGTAVLRAEGAPSRSVWALTLPDGAVAFGVATGDGELWIPGAPSVDEAELTRVL